MQVKHCAGCDVDKPLTEFHRDRTRRDGRTLRCRVCRLENRDRRSEYFRNWLGRMKADVFGHYGRACACCGATDALTIDHVNGDGREHRAALFGVTYKGGQQARMYRWLIKNNFPDGFQTLCQPCNSSKKRGQRCLLIHGGAR